MYDLNISAIDANRQLIKILQTMKFVDWKNTEQPFSHIHVSGFASAWTKR